MAREYSGFNRPRLLTAVFFIALAIALYWPWFMPGFISYGDWWHNLPSRVAEYYRDFLIWDGGGNLGSPLGLGFGNSLIIYWVPLLYGFLQETFGIATSISVRLVWFIPCVIFSFYGAWFLGYTISKRRLAATVTAIVYPLSTFALLDIQGGHMLIVLAYTLAPLALGLMIRLLRERSYKTAVWLALVLSLQAIYDIRVSYITLLSVGLYLLFYLLFDPDRRASLAGVARQFGTTVVIGVLLSSYWLMQLFFPSGTGQGLVPAGYDNVDWLKTLSYADLTHTLATNHVWWPWSEGVQMPIQPLFLFSLILAILALMQWKKYRQAIFFVFLFLLGAFLAKGVNPPLGSLYTWLFQHVPGFSFFRDPAKFFSLIMLGVAPAAGLGAVFLVDRAKTIWKKPAAILILFILLLPNFGIIFGERHGTFITKTLPAEYAQLADWLADQNEWGRVLWMPMIQRYTPASQLHPAVDYQAMSKASWAPFMRPNVATAGILAHPYGEWLLQHTGVSYLGVPYDSENEIFPYFTPAPTWKKAATSLSVKPVQNAPDKISLYALDNVKPEVYLADQAIVADAAVLPISIDLPKLANEVLVVKGINDHEFSVSDISEQLVALRPRVEVGKWDFYLNQNLSGELKLDTQLVNQAVTLDGKPISNPVSLTSGNHTIELNNANNSDNEAGKLAAAYSWQSCNAGQLKMDDNFSNNADESITLRPFSANSSGCAVINLGTLVPGLYRVVFNGLAESGIEGKISYTDVRGELKEVIFTPEVGNQVIGVLVRSTQPVSMLFTSTNTTGDDAVTGGANIKNIGVKQVLRGDPQQIRIVTAPKRVSDLAEVSFDKQSPRAYSLQLPARTQSSYLVLNQAYNSRWRLSGIDWLDHLEVNGGINGWFIPAGAAVTVQIVYGAFWPYWLGIGITLLTLITTISWLIKNRRRHV